ncbi:protein MpTRIHELIX14 [Marchantia polymorpha subsp. ruderalis]|uniref:Myb/SANT-like DNA-binding domain-containing protein n=2 Tax=Marchantia polymorpha TaxID=3197 RepID=A0AAF6AZJ4_MARPO|nr:hypothetical protein MARPO_0037s0099 [Marchantia polymorpha]BBN05178.1 hypothetical protein Mp_3g10970 [Marchantia polymorpha subsp. ruderalis]|eukprot:PTQ40926.1 hypothetical protein MARPO_0037s0099 [Marchantia polymorpha]
MDDESAFIDLATPAEDPVVSVPSAHSGGSTIRSNAASPTECVAGVHHGAATNSTAQSAITRTGTSPLGPMHLPPNSPSLLPLSPHIPCLCMAPPVQAMTNYVAMPFHASHSMHGTHQPHIPPVVFPSMTSPALQQRQESQSLVQERDSSTFENHHSGPASRTRKRSRNWEAWEILLLIQAKKAEFERYWGHPGRERLENSAQKYKRIVDYMRQHRVMDRDATACKNKWEALSGEYKVIKEWDRKPGNPTYSSLSFQERKQNNLPTSFETEAQELMDSFQGSRQHMVPPSVVDSTIRHSMSAGGTRAITVVPPGADSTVRHSPSAGDGGEGSTAEDEREQVPPTEEPEHIEIWASGKRKKSCGNVVAAFQELSQSIMRIEKERADRAREANEMAKDAHLLEMRKFEFLQMKMDREDERAEKFVGVLGSIAGAFHKMAEKM